MLILSRDCARKQDLVHGCLEVCLPSSRLLNDNSKIKSDDFFYDNYKKIFQMDIEMMGWLNLVLNY